MPSSLKTDRPELTKFQVTPERNEGSGARVAPPAREGELFPKEDRSAMFSDCRQYRYTLKIVWDENLSVAQFIGLNPSTADEFKDDPTLRRVKAFARSWGYGGVIMTNLFAYRATDPRVMRAYPEANRGPEQRHSDLVLREMCHRHRCMGPSRQPPGSQ